MNKEKEAFLQKKYKDKLVPKSMEELEASGAVQKKHGPGPGGRGMGGAKPKNAKATIQRLLGYVSKDKWKIVVGFICVILNTSLTLIGGYIMRPIINELVGPGEDKLLKLVKGITAMAIIYIFAAISQYMQSKIMIKVSQRAIFQLRNELFSKLESLPVSYFDKNANGDLMSRFTNDVDTIGEMLNSTVMQVFSGLITIVGTLSLMIYTNWILTIITFVTVPIMMTAIKKISKRSSKCYREQQAAIGTLNGYIEETVTGQKVVKVFNHEEAAKDEFDFLNHDLRSKQIKALFFGGIMGPVMGNLSQISYSLVSCIGGILCVARGFDVGGMTVFIGYSRQFSQPINQIAMQVNTLFSALAGAERVFKVMDETSEVMEEEGSIELGKASEVKGEVVLNNVSFGYTEDRLILKNISFFAKPGQKIALVGSTGAGKTTITNLVNRFYEINDGEILIDGTPISNISKSSLRKNIAMVLQDTHLFTGSVKDNIRYGREDATDEEVIEAAKTASAHSFIMRLEHGYDTILEGDGANLSQGQRQLINIARAAISKAPILILDEATSSVDTRTEKHIEHGMDRIMAERTTFVIAHRLSTVRNADAIMVLENGEIIERGDHEDLLKQKGRYYELYTGMSELA